MPRSLAAWFGLLLGLAATACNPPSQESSEGSETTAEPPATNIEIEAAREREEQARLAAEFPLTGRVTGVQLVVRERPDAESTDLGVLRIGSEIRLKDEPRPSATCASGWYPIYPVGWICVGQGVEVGGSEVRSLRPPRRHDPLPYHYYLVRQKMTPEYYRIPTPEERRAAWAYANRYLALLEENERRAQLFTEGKLRNEPEKPAVVGRYLARGFQIATASPEPVDEAGEFLRTVRGTYVWIERLQEQVASTFAGVELNEARTLPVAFAIRSGRPRIRIGDPPGPFRFLEMQEAEIIPRHTVLEDWRSRERFGEQVMHILDGDRYLRSWYASVVERIDPAVEGRFQFGDDEVWIHVDLSEQTLVVYRGRNSIFATLISTGLTGHETPTGYFRIQKKRITDTMSRLGPDAGDDAYRIEDVPWTQYFHGSIALHGAFWHDQFGLPRSHGCVNLSPSDAQRVFELTEPLVPEGWHGINANLQDRLGSRVIVTH